MKFYELGLAICGVLGVVYGVGFGTAYQKNPDNKGLKSIGLIGALVLLALFVGTLVLWFLGV